jgi:hypothetical protein
VLDEIREIDRVEGALRELHELELALVEGDVVDVADARVHDVDAVELDVGTCVGHEPEEAAVAAADFEQAPVARDVWQQTA